MNALLNAAVCAELFGSRGLIKEMGVWVWTDKTVSFYQLGIPTLNWWSSNFLDDMTLSTYHLGAHNPQSMSVRVCVWVCVWAILPQQKWSSSLGVLKAWHPWDPRRGQGPPGPKVWSATPGTQGMVRVSRDPRCGQGPQEWTCGQGPPGDPKVATDYIQKRIWTSIRLPLSLALKWASKA